MQKREHYHESTSYCIKTTIHFSLLPVHLPLGARVHQKNCRTFHAAVSLSDSNKYNVRYDSFLLYEYRKPYE